VGLSGDFFDTFLKSCLSSTDHPIRKVDIFVVNAGICTVRT
jgi:hypothetical protein